MRKILAAAVFLALSVLFAMAAPVSAQQLSPCMGGCDAEYPINYDAYAMWATYGYPTYSGGCWWYDVGGGSWWYMCPPDGNLYEY